MKILIAYMSQTGITKKIAEAMKPWLTRCREAATGANLIDIFNCQGEFAQYVIDELLKSADPEVRSWGEAGPLTKGQPDNTRLESARVFARKTMDRFKK